LKRLEIIAGVSVLAVVVAAVLLFSLVAVPQQPTQPGGKRIDIPNVNIKEVVYSVSSEKAAGNGAVFSRGGNKRPKGRN